jgi:hypothetical protein
MADTPQNATRSARGLAMLEQYRDEFLAPDESLLTVAVDIIADMLHALDNRGYTVEETESAAHMALNHYDAERE